MPTPLEIKKPYLTYCKKRDMHCPCLKCNNPSKYCNKQLSMKDRCKECSYLDINIMPKTDNNQTLACSFEVFEVYMDIKKSEL